MTRYPHGCDTDYEHELIAADELAAHGAGECKRGCEYCQLEKVDDAQGGMMAKSEPNLERLVVEIQEAGQAWIDAKLKSDQLEDGEKNYLAALMNSLQDAMASEKVSEAKLERLARGSAEFGEYVRGMVLARAETGRRKMRYESLRDLFEAKRSELAFEREKISKGIYHEGRG